MHQLLALWLTDVRYGSAGMTGLLLTRPFGSRRFARAELELLRAIHPELAGFLPRRRGSGSLAIEAVRRRHPNG